MYENDKMKIFMIVFTKPHFPYSWFASGLRILLDTLCVVSFLLHFL